MSRDFFSTTKDHYSSYRQYQRHKKTNTAAGDPPLELRLFTAVGITQQQFKPLQRALEAMIAVDQIGPDPESQYANDRLFIDLIKQIKRLGTPSKGETNPTYATAKAAQELHQSTAIALLEAQRDLDRIKAGKLDEDIDTFIAAKRCYPQYKLEFCQSALKSFQIHYESDFSATQQTELDQHFGSYIPPLTP